MDISIPAEGRDLMQKQRGDTLVEMATPVIPPGPLVLPQASTPVSQSAPTFFPGSLSIPSQPEFSHVRVHVDIFSEVFIWLLQKMCVGVSLCASVLSFPTELVLMSIPVATSHSYVLIVLCGS